MNIKSSFLKPFDKSHAWSLRTTASLGDVSGLSIRYRHGDRGADIVRYGSD